MIVSKLRRFIFLKLSYSNKQSDRYVEFLYICFHKSYPNWQNDADHSNRDGCQIITPKQGNFSKSLNFK